MDSAINDRTLCAARALLRWRQLDLSKESGVPVVYIRHFERGADMKPEHLRSVSEALHRAGVVVVGETSIDGTEVGEGVLLTTSASPIAPFEKRVYPERAAAEPPATKTRAIRADPTNSKPVGRRTSKPRG